MFTIKRRYPSFCTGFEETENFFMTSNDLLAISWVQYIQKASDFCHFEISKEPNSFNMYKL